MRVLVTGGLGYLGSHTALSLLKNKCEVFILDNLYNCKIDTLKKLQNLTNKKITFYKNDIRETEVVKEILIKNKITSVLHFAGLKSAKESILKKEEYFDVNVNGTNSILEAMEQTIKTQKNFVFSSSACVYGNPTKLPIKETHSTIPLNPYGDTKLKIEESLIKIKKEKEGWRIISLRYFNPLGSEDTYSLGESFKNLPENLMPFLTQVVDKKHPYLKVYGKDYNTHDGTAVRDYIHVLDLADAHFKALIKLEKKELNFEIINIGTGKGYSVLEIIDAFEEVNNVKVPFRFYPRREGDATATFADNTKAKKLLNWLPLRDIKDMCKDSWNYQKNN